MHKSICSSKDNFSKLFILPTKNCFENTITVGTCKIDLVLSDVFSKFDSSIIDTILSDEPYTSEDNLSKVHDRCKSSLEDISSAIEGTNLNHFQKESKLFKNI